jgi:hypothetical protein
MKSVNTILAAVVTFTALAGFGITSASAAVVTHKPQYKQAQPTTYKCTGELGHLRRVFTEQLDGVEYEQDVSIVPICEGEDYGVMRNDGNAGTLRQHIADNDAMVAALDTANFRADDVVGVRMTGDETVILYVHTFFYR